MEVNQENIAEVRSFNTDKLSRCFIQ